MSGFCESRFIFQSARALLACCLAISGLHAATIFAITANDQLLSIDSASGTASLLGTLDTASAALGIGFTGGSLYVFDTNNNLLRQVSATTGGTLGTTNVGIGNSPGEGDLAFFNGGGYLASTTQPDGSFTGSGTLYRFNVSASTSSVISTTLPLLDGLAFGADGTLYGLEQGGRFLYTVNPLTGAAAKVGSTGIPLCGGFPCYSFGGLTFFDGILYASLTNFVSPTSDFYRIDPATGAATLVGTSQFAQITGLTTDQTPVATPEPGTFALTAGFLAAVASRWRRRRGNAAR